MISIVISFYDNSRILALCLAQMLPTLSGHNVEVVVVDDNPDRPISRTSLAPRWVRVVRSKANLGYSGACNLGVDAARGSHIVFVDSDIVPTKGWLTELLKTSSEVPEAGAIGAKILDLSSGAIVAYGASIYGVDTVHPYRGNGANYTLTLQNRNFQLVPSGTMLIRRELFQSLGGFDPVFRNAFCDFDLSMKLSRAGFPGYVSSKSLVYHRGTVAGAIRHASYADTKALFFKKWSTEIREDGLQFLEDSCRLLSSQGIDTTKQFLAVNLSSSLNWPGYVEAARSVLAARIVQYYSVPAIERNASHVRLEDHLDWQTCRLRTPIIYFVDRYRSIARNFYWFSHRPTKNDIVIDRNGNALAVRSLL
jgi:GT2 family glycosyltransferase